MKKIFIASLFAAAVTLALASEKRVRLQDLPEAVQKAAASQTKGAAVHGYSQETENGQTMYEVETTAAGKSRDLLFDASGNVVEVEQQVELGTLPATVQDGLRKAAAGAKIAKVESVTRNGHVSYEAATTKAGKRGEVAVDSEGHPAR